MLLEVVTYIDGAYAPHLAAMLRSVGETLAEGYKVRAHIMYLDVDEPTKTAVERSVADLAMLELAWLPIDAREFAAFYTSGHVNSTSYFRLRSAEIPGLKSSRLLLLDSDLVVRASIHPLFQLDLAGKAIGAVVDSGAPYIGMVDRGLFSSSGRDPWDLVFNAGVLVVDLVRWRAAEPFRRAQELATEYPGKYLFWDQCLLNQIFHGQWLPLPSAWNQQTAVFDLDPRLSHPVAAGDLANARLAPKIVHYTTNRKPWTGWRLHPFSHLYFQHARRTAFPVAVKVGAVERLRHWLFCRKKAKGYVATQARVFDEFFSRFSGSAQAL